MTTQSQNPTFQCRIELPYGRTIHDIAATFGREGIHLATNDPAEVFRHIKEVTEGDSRLEGYHMLYADGSPYKLTRVGNVTEKGQVVRKERE